MFKKTFPRHLTKSETIDLRYKLRRLQWFDKLQYNGQCYLVGGSYMFDDVEFHDKLNNVWWNSRELVSSRRKTLMKDIEEFFSSNNIREGTVVNIV
jgi:hypothetical protein